MIIVTYIGYVAAKPTENHYLWIEIIDLINYKDLRLNTSTKIAFANTQNSKGLAAVPPDVVLWNNLDKI